MVNSILVCRLHGTKNEHFVLWFGVRSGKREPTNSIYDMRHGALKAIIIEREHRSTFVRSLAVDDGDYKTHRSEYSWAWGIGRRRDPDGASIEYETEARKERKGTIKEYIVGAGRCS